MRSLVKCCWVGAALGFAAVLASACGKTDVSCDDLATCPENVGGSEDSGRIDANTADARDGAGGSSSRDASAPDAEASAEASPSAPLDGGRDASLDGSVAQDADLNADASEASLGDAPADAVAEEVGPQCEAGADPSVESCIVNDAYGVFVSPLGNDRFDGSKATPFRTIGHALTSAMAHGGRVFACGSQGVYAESLAIGAALGGVALYGGFDCTSWVHSSALRVVVRPATPGIALTVNGVTSLLVQDVEFDAANAVAPGDSSVAIFVASSTGVVFTRVRAVAGNGASGSPGTSGGTLAGVGVAGSQANLACMPLVSAATGTRACGAEQSSGGFGGFGGNIVGSTGAQGSSGASTPAVTPLRGQGGLGEGQQDGLAWDCSSVDTGLGQPGGAGAEGTPGVGATSSGALSSTGWQGSSGTSGSDGHIGQGGGGGGGARAPGTCPGADSGLPTGASGGSGGSGGCGGAAGGGGMSGGSSIAILVFASQVSLSSSEIVTGIGGRGGNGGAAQQGGIGGGGGAGNGGINGSHPSCAGGTGGRGGNGGSGGGGAGGSTIGIAATTAGSSVLVTGTTFLPGTVGQAGLDGNGIATAPGAGAAGSSMNQVML
jgi:hypothetical protein